MNIKSQISLMLDCKPIINKEDNTIFFYPQVKKDNKIISESNYENVWSWLIPEGQDVISTGLWCVDRNAYVITEKPWTTFNCLSFKLLPRDFNTIDNYEKGVN